MGSKIVWLGKGFFRKMGKVYIVSYMLYSKYWVQKRERRFPKNGKKNSYAVNEPALGIFPHQHRTVMSRNWLNENHKIVYQSSTYYWEISVNW